MPRFSRTDPAPPISSDYRTYRPYVRHDFQKSCAYCLLSELFAAGEENFELDHYKPKKTFPEDKLNYYNIYYSCHPCNHIKHIKWPANKLGVSIVDFCQTDFESQYVEELDGSWTPLSPSATYTVEALRLNRPHLKRIRQLVRQLNSSMVRDE